LLVGHYNHHRHSSSVFFRTSGSYFLLVYSWSSRRNVLASAREGRPDEPDQKGRGDLSDIRGSLSAMEATSEEVASISKLCDRRYKKTKASLPIDTPSENVSRAIHQQAAICQFIFRGELKPEQGYLYIDVEIVSLQRKTRRLMEERVMFTGNVNKEIVTASNNS
jgi:hypothetical protein